jgi:hypothetical protein
MAKLSLADHMKERRIRQEQEAGKGGPFITISRQFGCYGFSLGLLLLEILNEETIGATWSIYHKEILWKLATETKLALETIERQRRSKPSMLENLLRSLSGERIPSGYEIRNRITEIIRSLAIEGHAIIIGQGGAASTSDLANGLTVRLEAPEEWRVKQVAFREGLSEVEAKLKVRAKEQEREYLRKIYEARSRRRPAFQLTYDCSAFSLAQIAQHVVHMMKLKKVI